MNKGLRLIETVLDVFERVVRPLCQKESLDK